MRLRFRHEYSRLPHKFGCVTKSSVTHITFLEIFRIVSLCDFFAFFNIIFIWYNDKHNALKDLHVICVAKINVYIGNENASILLIFDHMCEVVHR